MVTQVVDGGASGGGSRVLDRLGDKTKQRKEAKGEGGLPELQAGLCLFFSSSSFSSPSLSFFAAVLFCSSLLLLLPLSSSLFFFLFSRFFPSSSFSHGSPSLFLSRFFFRIFFPLSISLPGSPLFSSFFPLRNLLLPFLSPSSPFSFFFRFLFFLLEP